MRRECGAKFMHKKLALIFAAFGLVATTPLAAQPRGDEPIAVPRTIKQGIDFVYVDPELSTVARRRQRPQNWLARLFDFGSNRRDGPNPLFYELGRGLQQYQATWGRLPQVKIPAGATLKRGATGKRVALLRERLGLPRAGSYDDRVVHLVSAYQQVHGLGSIDGIAGKATIASLNRGSTHYARKIAINVERAYRLPPMRRFDRYVVVDSGSAVASLVVGDRVVDSMRVIVGSAETKTPIMAVLMRNARANPYWNVPPELVQSLTAKRIQQDGLSYLKNFHYEVLRDWSADAPVIDPKTVNWKAIASGRQEPTIRVRQLPGPWNSMGEMKFEMRNDYGIYLHDTPLKEKFEGDRWISNGCVRLEDYQRFARWVFGQSPRPSSQREQVIALPRPVPIYLTYLTVQTRGNGVVFLPDPYGWDALAMPQMFGPATRIASAD
jgi:murein L,D-transpeptidase YcbB/YkuD